MHALTGVLVCVHLRKLAIWRLCLSCTEDAILIDCLIVRAEAANPSDKVYATCCDKPLRETALTDH